MILVDLYIWYIVLWIKIFKALEPSAVSTPQSIILKGQPHLAVESCTDHKRCLLTFSTALLIAVERHRAVEKFDKNGVWLVKVKTFPRGCSVKLIDWKSWEMNLWLWQLVMLTNFMSIYFWTALFSNRCEHMLETDDILSCNA